jgi:triphosphoribosyl-dephospho-CoA synthase
VLIAVASGVRAAASAAADAPSSPALWVQHIGRVATVALYDELALAPKPGLVSFVDTGSHTDMDATTFMRSLFALRHYFVRMAMLGAAHATFAELEAAGVAAEVRMLHATRGINTHRGAIFSLGLLCAAAGRASSFAERLTAAGVRAHLRVAWGEALRHRCGRASSSNGHRVVQTWGLRGVGEEAALGFPTLFEAAVPALAAARVSGLDDRHARLQALFEIIAVLDDTNLAHRGGLAGLRFAQAQAHAFLRAGGAMRPDALRHAQSIHLAFVQRRLSPGGAADVLAAACWVERVDRAA